jgi:hypothetical protein
MKRWKIDEEERREMEEQQGEIVLNQEKKR